MRCSDTATSNQMRNSSRRRYNGLELHRESDDRSQFIFQGAASFLYTPPLIFTVDHDVINVYPSTLSVGAFVDDAGERRGEKKRMRRLDSLNISPPDLVCLSLS